MWSQLGVVAMTTSSSPGAWHLLFPSGRGHVLLHSKCWPWPKLQPRLAAAPAPRTGPGNAGATGIDSFLLPLHMTWRTALWSPSLPKACPWRMWSGLVARILVTLALLAPQFPQMLQPELLGLYLMKLSLTTKAADHEGC